MSSDLILLFLYLAPYFFPTWTFCGHRHTGSIWSSHWLLLVGCKFVYRGIKVIGLLLSLLISILAFNVNAIESCKGSKVFINCDLNGSSFVYIKYIQMIKYAKWLNVHVRSVSANTHVYECIIIIKVSSIWMVYFLANRSASEGLLKAFLHACVDPWRC